jgi:fibronectin type 3 domain-containing protein
MKKLSLSALLIVSTLLWFSGCAEGTPSPLAKKVQVDPQLPAIQLTPTGVIAQMNQVAFEWKPITNSTVEGIKVYRTNPGEEETYLIHTIKNRYATHFVDLDVKPDTKYIYSFRTYAKDKISQKSKRIQVRTKAVLPSVSWIYVRSGMPKMAKLLWRPHNNQAVKYYIIERKSVEDAHWNEIAKIEGRLQAEYIDTDLKDNYIYKYRIKVETCDGIVSTPSKVVQILTKKLPPLVLGIKASIDEPKQITITWDKSTYKDFERYYLYRSEDKMGDYKLIARLYANYFVDKVGEDAVHYFYKVTQVDSDGLESPKESSAIAMGETLGKPMAPTIASATLQGSQIVLKWFQVDPRNVAYIVERQAKSGWLDAKTTKYKTTSTTFIDRNIEPNTTYTYRVYGVDSHNVVSNESQFVVVEVKELDFPPANNQAQQQVEQVQQQARDYKTQQKQKISQQSTPEVVVPVDGLDVDVE